MGVKDAQAQWPHHFLEIQGIRQECVGQADPQRQAVQAGQGPVKVSSRKGEEAGPHRDSEERQLFEHQSR